MTWKSSRGHSCCPQFGHDLKLEGKLVWSLFINWEFTLSVSLWMKGTWQRWLPCDKGLSFLHTQTLSNFWLHSWNTKQMQDRNQYHLTHGSFVTPITSHWVCHHSFHINNRNALKQMSENSNKLKFKPSSYTLGSCTFIVNVLKRPPPLSL